MRYQEILEACWTGYRQAGMKKKGDRQVPNCVPVSEQEMEEDLKKWFKEKWVRFGPDGKIRGDCARGSESEGKPKCLPQSKAHALGKKGRASAAAKKRREDPNPERRGPAKNVATKVKEGVVADALKDYLQVTGTDDVEAVKNAIQKIAGDSSLKPMAKARLLGQVGMMIKTHRLPIGKEYYQYMQQFMEEELDEASVTKKPQPYNDPDWWKKLSPEELRKLTGPDYKKDKKEKVDEKQDACYRKVKSRYKVWPSAYASGALVQCRKKGAANWGNKTKK
jgi:hypothetical protein